ncbi:MAG: hypothetical protein B6247_09740 [Candidatus Parabeggiatoa sp. nov. 2]|nr:MAG: hypothetical protein B6247_09740 [Beggiatoa sp. 4572_84]
MDNEDNNEKTYWHQILGRILEFLLTPVGIIVLTDVKVVNKLPEAYVLLLKTKSKKWTQKQLERLPDGIRDSTTNDVLLEFKATESINKNTFIQTAWYEYSYKRSQEIADDEIQTFLICAKQPQKDNREQYGYTIQVQAGVYKSTHIAYNHITLISLNELPNKLHNAWITCLASKKLKRLKSFQLLKEQGFKQIKKAFKGFLKAIGDMWGVQYYSQEELDKLLNERLRGMRPKDVVNYFKSEQLEEIEAILKQRKQQR